MRTGNQRVCAVCARVLDSRENTTTGEWTWEHTLQDQKFEDHPAVPVMPEEIAPRYRCDFCNEDKTTPGWVIPAKDFAMPGITQPGAAKNMSTGDWAACDVCEPLIAADDWAGLLTRVTAGAAMHSAMPVDLLRVQLARMYHRLRANMSGPPYRNTPGREN